MAIPRYEETQYFAAWVYVLLVLVLLGTLAPVFILLFTEEDVSASVLWSQPIIGALVVLFVVDVMVLKTRLDPMELFVKLGHIPLCWKHIPLNTIQEVRQVQYRPIRDAGGWGMRYGRFEGEKCRFYNARGDRGVLVVTAHQRYIIGSQQPDQLELALQDMLRK